MTREPRSEDVGAEAPPTGSLTASPASALQPPACLVPGKVMLAGEYAVLVPGGVAVAAALPPGFRVACTPATGDRVVLPDLGLDLALASGRQAPAGAPRAVRLVAAALRAAAAETEAAGATLGPVAVTGACAATADDEYVAAGASAALTVGTVTAALRAAGMAPPPRHVAALAHAAHAQVQGGGSGYDIYTAALGGLVRVEVGAPDAPARRAQARADLAGVVLVVAHTGQAADTVAMLQRHAAALGWRGYDEALAAHCAASRALADALWAGDTAALPAAVARAEATLRRLDAAGGLGVFVPVLDSLLAAAARAGIPARVSGAGGGDVAVGLAPDGAAAHRLAKTWRPLCAAVRVFAAVAPGATCSPARVSGESGRGGRPPLRG